ncbi:MAG: CotH kinase family protein [Deltaproteobacteria bacterium]|nr:CotH kinase family protein [Deltaproteobacteria bacterium]
MQRGIPAVWSPQAWCCVALALGLSAGCTSGRDPVSAAGHDATSQVGADASSDLAGPGKSGDPGAPLFDPSKVHEIALDLDDVAVAALAADPTQWAAGTLALAGAGTEIAPRPVRVKLKGRPGMGLQALAQKPSLKIDFKGAAGGGPVLGQSRITLNNMASDPSMVNEALAYQLFATLGVASPRCGYARVTVNGQVKGLYALLEPPTEELANRLFPSTAHLYEADDRQGVDFLPGQESRFQVQVGGKQTGDLSALIAALQAPSPTFLAGKQSPRVDWPATLRYLAAEHLLGARDGYLGTGRHYLVHADATGAFRLAPWSLDEAFTGQVPASTHLLDVCRADPTCAALADQTTADVAHALWALDLEGITAGLVAVVSPHAAGPVASPQTIAANLRTVIAAVHCSVHPGHDLDGDGVPCPADCADGNPQVHPGVVDQYDKQKCPGPLLPEHCTYGGACCDVDGVDNDCSGLHSDAPGCPDCAVQMVGGHRYLLCGRPRTWQDARANCLALGSDLADVNLASELAMFGWQAPWVLAPSEGAPGTLCPKLGGRQPMTACEQLRTSVCEDPCPPGLDGDGDGYGPCQLDCNDSDATVHPGATEVCNSKDDDCDGLWDPGCPQSYDED